MVSVRVRDSARIFTQSRRWIGRLFDPIDLASLVYFRIAFGGLMLWEISRYLAGGRVSSLWIEPEFHFKYLAFEWVQAPPGFGM